MRRKITVIGAGNVGATAAQEIARRDYADVVLVDIIEGLPQGKALDMNEAGPVLGYEAKIVGTNGYAEAVGSDVVVVTSGKPRSPGMSRDDLVTTNQAIVRAVTEQAVAASPGAIVVVVTNPLDAMCHVAKDASGLPKERVFGMAGILDTARFRTFIAWATGASARDASGFPKERVFGMAGILDTARFRTFIAWETGMSDRDVQTLVLGGHGDQMVPVVSATTVGGVPLTDLVPEERIAQMVERTRKGGGEVVNLLGTSAWYAPGAAIAQMVDSIVLDQKRVLPCTAYLEGEYGIDGLYMGVPVVLGAGGVEQIVELELTESERAELERSAGAVREVVAVLAG